MGGPGQTEPGGGAELENWTWRGGSLSVGEAPAAPAHPRTPRLEGGGQWLGVGLRGAPRLAVSLHSERRDRQLPLRRIKREPALGFRSPTFLH